MENKIYGYVRVSSIDQNEERQLMALNKVNVPTKNIKNISASRFHFLRFISHVLLCLYKKTMADPKAIPGNAICLTLRNVPVSRGTSDRQAPPLTS